MYIYIYIYYLFYIFFFSLLCAQRAGSHATNEEKGRQANPVTKWTRIESLNYPDTTKRETSQPAPSETEIGIDSWNNPANWRGCSTAGDPDRL